LTGREFIADAPAKQLWKNTNENNFCSNRRHSLCQRESSISAGQNLKIWKDVSVIVNQIHPVILINTKKALKTGRTTFCAELLVNH